MMASLWTFLVTAAVFWLGVTGIFTQGKGKDKGEPFPSLLDVTLDDLIHGLNEGHFTSTDLVKTYLARIEQVNDELHAVTETNPDALDIAASLDEQLSKGKVKGPLHGIPILIKNNIATKDKMNNTAGSYALLGATVPEDSTIAKKLREAGAIILGKTNLSQWANYRSNWITSSNGWSAQGGQVEAAYYPHQDPIGSSSGSGVATALGLSFASLGTETDGSIIAPSERNNLVGIKPTVGLTSRYLVIPISEHQDTIGPMARTVKDAAYLLQAIVGEDPQDNYSSAIPEIPDYVKACDDGVKSAPRGARIGVPMNVMELYSSEQMKPEIDAFNKAVKLLQDSGATVVESNFTMLNELTESNVESKVLGADFISNLASYLSQLTTNPNNLHSLSDIRDFTQRDSREDYPDRDTAIWGGLLDAQSYNNTDPRFWVAYQEKLRLGGEGGLLGAIKRNNLAAVVLPTSFASTFAALVGAPVVTVPLGFYPSDAPVVMNSRGNLVSTAPGVPFGLSFLGAPWQEACLIGLSCAFEAKTMVRRRGKLVISPTVELGQVSRLQGA